MTTPEGTSMAARAQAVEAERVRLVELQQITAAGLTKYGAKYASIQQTAAEIARAAGLSMQPTGRADDVRVGLAIAKIAFEWCEDLRRTSGLSTSDEQAAGPGTEWVERPQQLRFNLSEHQQAALWPEGENYH
jgi:hypothetical protein